MLKLWLLLLLYAMSVDGYGGLALEESRNGSIERLPGDTDGNIYNYVAFMSIPAVSQKTCREIYKRTWRQTLLLMYTEKHSTNWAVCSPYGYNYEPDTCACRYCSRYERSFKTKYHTHTKYHNERLDCVSRAWMRRHPPRVSLGVGSMNDGMYLLDFYNDTAEAPVVVNIPVANENEVEMLPALMKFDKKVDALLLMSDVEKGEAKILCGVEGAQAHSRSPRCKETLEKFFAASDFGMVPIGLEVGACELVFPGTLKANKGQLYFVSALAETVTGIALLRIFHFQFYGRVAGPTTYTEELREKLDGLNVSYTVYGQVTQDVLHGGFCRCDGVVVFPLRDRNPRVFYEAVQSLKPIFVSQEANIPHAATCQEFVTTARTMNTTSVEVRRAFYDFARSMPSWRSREAHFVNFVKDCASVENSLESIWSLVTARFGSGHSRTAPARETVICQTPVVHSASCERQFHCESGEEHEPCQLLRELPLKSALFDFTYDNKLLSDPPMKSSFYPNTTFRLRHEVRADRIQFTEEGVPTKDDRKQYLGDMR